MRLIDADKLRKDLVESKEKLWRLYKGLSHPVDKQICGGEIGTFTEVILRLDDALTIDAVPVVRCKDCKHWTVDGAGTPWCDMWEASQYHEEVFCYFGERRSNT